MTDASAAERLAVVRAAIDKAARLAGRDPGEVTLVAVSKTQSADAIAPLIAAGQRTLANGSGGAGKVAGAARGHPDHSPSGRQPQSNKAADAVACSTSFMVSTARRW